MHKGKGTKIGQVLSLGVTLGVLLGLSLSPAIVRGDAASVTVTIDAPPEVAQDSDFVVRASISAVQDFDAAQPVFDT